MSNQFINADALDDQDQFLLTNSTKRSLLSGTDESDHEGQRVTKSRNKKKQKQRPTTKNTIVEDEILIDLGKSHIVEAKNIVSQEKPTSSFKNKKNRTSVRPSDDIKRTKPSNKKSKAEPKPFFQLELGPLTTSPGEETSIGLQPPDLQLSYLIDRQKRALPKLSDLELQTLAFHQSWLLDVSNKPQRAQLGAWLNSGAIPEFLETAKMETTVTGSPVLLVIASAALRAVELCKQVKPLLPSPKTSGGVAKLFARHFKLSEHITHLSTAPVAVGVGTPDRLSKLIEAKAIKLDRLRWIMLDTTWLDTKSYSLADLPDKAVREAVWQGILGNSQILTMLKAGQTKLVLF
ncbi:U3-containing 90S pre-ribosomal complex subunit-domain containing protein [Melampsora americana]|nr:U3-containing 90S pre-ribosomal complex subunit-domain containing protein [Melampsora americana]